MHPPRVLLAGNPNTGKSTLFNALTGARQKVGNYPGVTVEKRQGRARLGDEAFDVLDLPGTFSLGSYSPEERIAQRELLATEGEVVVMVADATNLKRSLVLLAQLLQLPQRFVLCLNMADEAEHAGQQLDIALLEELLGIPVVPTAGHVGRGVRELGEAVQRAHEAPLKTPRLVLGDRLQASVLRIARALRETSLPPGQLTWYADRLLVRDEQTLSLVRAEGDAGRAALRLADEERAALEADTGMEAALYVTDCYYGFVDGLLREAVQRHARADARALSDRIDSVLVHPALGVPFFLAVMYAVFWLTFTVGETPMEWIDSAFGALGTLVASLWPAGTASPLESLLVDGIIGGVGGVLVFLPNIMLLFLGLAVLEDSGYMARAAFIVDRFMHRFGLHGRSFVPMVTGFGCSIPGIMATRTIENERDRLTTMMVVPLMSCGARLPIWMLLVPAFFAPAWRAPMLWCIYLFGIALALAVALLLRRTLLRGDEAPFVMELPPYRLPTLHSIFSKVFDRSWLYVRKAGTVILAISIVMWFITAYPQAKSYDIDADLAAGRARIAAADAPPGPDGQRTLTAVEVAQERAAEDLKSSVAGRLGVLMEPVLRPMGMDWKAGIGLVGAFAAKEVFVAQLGIVHALGEANEDSIPLRQDLANDYSPHAGLALMFFLLIATPCMATVAVTKRESGSWKWALLQFGGLTALGYVIAVITFQIGQLLT